MQPLDEIIATKFLGIRNTVSPRSIPDNAMTDAVNVDVDNEGAYIRRRGWGAETPIADCTAAFTGDEHSYLVAGGRLYRIRADLTLRDLGPSTASSFAEFGSTLFTNDGLMVRHDTVVDLKLPVPETPPDAYIEESAELLPNDTIIPATISYAYTYRRLSSGMEGGSSPVATAFVPPGATLRIVDPPAPDGYESIIYRTDPGGSVLYSPAGEHLDPPYMAAEPFPADCTHVAFHMGMLHCAVPMQDGKTLVLMSAPHQYHLYDHGERYIIVPGQVRGMHPVGDTLVIATSVAVLGWDGSSLAELAPYGVPPGEPLCKMPDGSAMLATYRGVCKVMPFENLTEGKALFPPGTLCSTAYVPQDGIKKFVVLTDGAGAPFNTRF